MLRGLWLLLAIGGAVMALVTMSPSTGPTVTVPARVDDADGDDIPNRIEQHICGSETCADGLDDTDRDGLPDWAELVVCGTSTCARVDEDDDANGVPDALEAIAHVADRRVVAVTGMPFAWVSPAFATAAGVLLLSLAVASVRNGRPDETRTEPGPPQYGRTIP